MIYTHENNKNSDSSLNADFTELRADCEKCFGLCCVALYFCASEDFPNDKASGKPCENLQSDFRCSIHESLRKSGYKGCTAYDCFGAGQKVAQVTYGGQDWRKCPETAKQMFDVLLIMSQLHEMIWFLTEALTLQASHSIHEELSRMICETELLTYLKADALTELDLDTHRNKVNSLLQKVSELVRAKACSTPKPLLRHKKMFAGRLDFIGADLRKINLKGAELRGAFLMAANLRDVDLSSADLLGADLRDADISGADLSNTIFLTQAQINGAKGNSHTKLPASLTPPTYWSK